METEGLMASNTDLADVNEIYTAFLLNGNTFPDAITQKQYETKSKLLTPEQLEQQQGRAAAMVDVFNKWATKNGYNGISSVYWTARPGFTFEPITGYKVNQKKNPTDVLIKYNSGKFLGISAKSTKGKGDIGFKNPGIGTIDRELKLNLAAIPKAVADNFAATVGLPKPANARKSKIRQNPALQKQADALGLDVLNTLREQFLARLNQLTPQQRREYIVNSWIDAGEGLLPRYVKVTGRGTKEPYSASLDDPLNNEKLKKITSEQITFESVGNDSVGVKAGLKKIMKMRFKYESQKLASTVKMSGDPW